MSDTAVVTLTDRAYFSRAKRTIIDVRTRGQWKGDLVLVTIGFDASPNFLDYYGVTGKRFESIDTTQLVQQYEKYPLQTVEDKRHIYKLAQWNKLHVFDPWFARWKRIVFLDAGLRVFDSIHYLLEVPWEGKILAPDDLPKYDTTNGFERMMELSANPPVADALLREYSVDILKQRYFLNCIWVYDTALLSKCNNTHLIVAMNAYPIARCNEMTIMNLLFTFKHRVWLPFPEFASNGKRLFGWTEHDRDYGPYGTWRNFCFLKYPFTINFECD
jgi:hypothetical protein